jgi:hypothetical protein
LLFISLSSVYYETNRDTELSVATAEQLSFIN